MSVLAQDLIYGFRMFRKNPGFTAIAILTVALGIGANTAIFSLIDSLFLRTLPVRDPSHLVNVFQTRANCEFCALSYPDYVYYRDHNHVFSDLAAHYSFAPINLVVSGESTEINGSVISGNYFSVVGVRPFLGRFFLSDEDAIPGKNPVAAISYALWQRRFAGDPQILGKSIILNGTAFTVIGIAPRDFYGVVLGGLANDVWIPSAMFHVGYRYCNTSQRDCTIVRLLGRLKPGHTLTDAQSEMNVLARQLAAEYPEADKGLGVNLTLARGVNSETREDSARASKLLLVAVVLVLFIACANLAGLLLARGATRRKEIAVRLALGANRWRVIRQLLTESLMLSLLGGAAGLLVGLWAKDLLSIFYSVDSEGRRAYFMIGLDLTVLIFSAGISFLTGILFGLAPALQLSRPELIPALKSEGSSSSTQRTRLRDALIVIQVALAVVLVVGAGLLVRSVQSVYRGPGFDPSHIVLLRLRPSLVAYSPSKASAFQREVIRRLGSLPGVLSASPAQMAPLPGWGYHVSLWLPGQVAARPEDVYRAPSNMVGPRYFETLGIPVLDGREFGDQDRVEQPRAVIINETIARHFWPHESPVSQAIMVNGEKYLVVGVVKDAQYYSNSQPSAPFIYLSFWQQDSLATSPIDSRTHVRIAGDPGRMLPLIRREIAAVDPDVPISEDRPLKEWLNYSFQPVLVASTLFACFAALAIFLSALGLYGVLAFTVSQRTREIGIRLALGAERNDVTRIVVRQGAILAVTGVFGGLLAAFALAHFLASLIYGVRQYDPLTFLVAPAALVFVALMASYIPARRAAAVDPIIALRHE